MRKISRREKEGALEEHNLLYPSKYFGMEIKRTPDGTEVSGSYSVVNHVYVNGVRAAALTPGGEALYYLTDQVDSVKVVVNDRGKPVTRTEYLPYGETWFTEGDEGNAPKFNSQELDRETNFYFYNARYYDPEIARFVTADNLVDNESDTQGWNRFSYVKGNPVVYKDPTGHERNYADEYFKGAIKTYVSDLTISYKLMSGYDQIEKSIEAYKSIKNNYDDYINKGFSIYVDGKVRKVRNGLRRAIKDVKDNPAEYGGMLSVKFGETILCGRFAYNDLYKAGLNKDIASNFKGYIRKAKLKNDKNAYRVFTGSKGQSSARGKWLSPNKLISRLQAIEELALPDENPAKYMEHQVIPRGTTIYEGQVRGQFGRKGGGQQIYVENQNSIVRDRKLKEVLK